MATITVPWKQKPVPPSPPTLPRIHKKALGGTLVLQEFEGQFRVLYHSCLIIDHVPKEVAEAKFEQVLHPVPVSSLQVPTQPVVSIPELPTSSHTCPTCGFLVSDGRTLLLHTETCPHCTPQPSKPLGVMSYGHKTGGVLEITSSPKVFSMLKRPANRQR